MTRKIIGPATVFATMAISLASATVSQAETNQELAIELANPMSSLISVPIEYGYDQGLGTSGSGTQRLWVVKPVIPFSLSENWNVISRTIIPFVSLDDVTPGSSTSGMGDILQNFFFSPKQPTSRGVVWGGGSCFANPHIFKQRFRKK